MQNIQNELRNAEFQQSLRDAENQRINAENRYEDKKEKYTMKLIELKAEYDSTDDSMRKKALKEQYDTIWDMRHAMLEEHKRRIEEAEERVRKASVRMGILTGVFIFILLGVGIWAWLGGYLPF